MINTILVLVNDSGGIFFYIGVFDMNAVLLSTDSFGLTASGRTQSLSTFFSCLDCFIDVNTSARLWNSYASISWETYRLSFYYIDAMIVASNLARKKAHRPAIISNYSSIGQFVYYT